jgi:cytochrome b6
MRAKQEQFFVPVTVADLTRPGTLFPALHQGLWSLIELKSQEMTSLSPRERRMKNFFESLFVYFDERLKISALLEFGKKKKVPEHKYGFWYYFGGICLFLFVIQVFTGVLLLLYYTPSIDAAHESIEFIMSRVPFGWLIRSVHSWTANILIGMIFIHMFSTFLLKAYRTPRELTWVTGFFLLLIFLGFGFSGFLLPWNELSFFATKVGTDIAGLLPFIGKQIKNFILGGPGVSGATLSRFFWLHIAILPIFTLLIMGVHILLVQILGMSKPIGLPEAKIKEVSFYPNFILKDALGWTLILVAIGVLCVFLPWEVGQKADPFAPTPLGIKPEWYFTFMFSTLKIIPSHVLIVEGEKLAILGFILAGFLWMLVPFLDRNASRGKKSTVFSIIGILVIVYIIAMTALTYLRPKK